MLQLSHVRLFDELLGDISAGGEVSSDLSIGSLIDVSAPVSEGSHDIMNPDQMLEHVNIVYT